MASYRKKYLAVYDSKIGRRICSQRSKTKETFDIERPKLKGLKKCAIVLIIMCLDLPDSYISKLLEKAERFSVCSLNYAPID
jgi:hypothetical protein